MPAVTKGKVLVTGANGYVALWVVKTLLGAGFSVRGTVRSESRIAYLKETFKEYADKIEFVVVPDITKEGAFDEAVKGVDAIAHTASPFHLHATEPAELFEPAIKGTRSILTSTLQHANNTVKRVVVTSSSAAIVHPVDGPVVFTEADWNDAAVQEVESKGRDAGPVAMYQASKTLAERAAWEFIESNKGKVGFDLVTLNPPFIYGPILHEVASPDALNTSMGDWFGAIKGQKSDEELVSNQYPWVDVRDVALAHKLAIQKEAAGGERIIVSAGITNWQDWVIAARKLDSSLPAGNTKYDPETAKYPTRFDSSKSVRILGIKYRPLEETTADIIKQFKQKGWIN